MSEYTIDRLALPDEPSEQTVDDLRSSIVKWLADASCFMPALPQGSLGRSVKDVKTFELRLPSSVVSEETRRDPRVQELGRIEYALREAEAHDALTQLRQAISGLAKINHLKSKYTHGHRGKTRTNHLKEYWTEVKHTATTLYKHAYACLTSLGLPAEGNCLRPLHKDDTYRPDIREPHELGSGTKAPGWIWTVASDCLLTGAEPESKEGVF